ncbi:MAG: CBS domain-containing protein [Candidatus Omnitrophica bacterium]|nr:CBS domain-containing protein [Candidatus Omnitrophota bacterium]
MISDIFIPKNMILKQAMRQMDKGGQRILFVVDGQGRLIGSLSDGDIRRGIIKNHDLNDSIATVYNSRPFFSAQPYDLEKVKAAMVTMKIERVPVIDEHRRIVAVLKWEDLFGGNRPVKDKLSIPVMIMAGGKGTRLDPVTRILPKPLVPIGERSIIDIIIDKFTEYGMEEFYISIQHKAKLIKAFFEEKDVAYKVHFIEEQKPLGTAGSLRLLLGRIRDRVWVSNCDIIIDGNYAEIADFHLKGGYDLTIVGSFRHFTVPYGICRIADGGELEDMIEKPEYDFLVNTGMVLVEKRALRLIPANREFHIPDLIAKIKKKGGKVGVFPVNEKSWIDIGEWEKYKQTMEDFEKKI